MICMILVGLYNICIFYIYTFEKMHDILNSLSYACMILGFTQITRALG